jgi:hypothetical protein
MNGWCRNPRIVSRRWAWAVGIGINGHLIFHYLPVGAVTMFYIWVHTAGKTAGRVLARKDGQSQSLKAAE